MLKKISKNLISTEKQNIADKKENFSTQEVFSEIFNNSCDELFKKKLEKILQQVDKHSEKLKKNLTFLQLKEYKQAVKDFLNEVVKHTYNLGEGKFWNKKGKQKILNLIKKVDNSLENLTRLFIKSESNRLHILVKLEEIKGMLVDLYK